MAFSKMFKDGHLTPSVCKRIDEMKIGDFVRHHDRPPNCHPGIDAPYPGAHGIILEFRYSGWGEVKKWGFADVLWENGTVSETKPDQLEVINENR